MYVGPCTSPSASANARRRRRVPPSLTKLKSAPQVAAVLDPFKVGAVNPTGTTAYIQVSYSVSASYVLGLAVAIDYSLFIVSRYRHELATGRDPEDAIGYALATAGSAVVFAGATVVIALTALAVVGIPLLTRSRHTREARPAPTRDRNLSTMSKLLSVKQLPN